MFNTFSNNHSRFANNPSFWVVMCLLVMGVHPNESLSAPKPFTHRFVYSNLGMAPKGIDSCIGRMRAAASLGYNGYVTTNHEDDYLEDVSQNYVNCVKRTVGEAKKLKIALIPEHFVQNSEAKHNYNLSEAFPVRNTKFIVSNGKAKAVADHETGFKNGGFESYTGNKPDGWALYAMPGATIDESVYKSGKASLRISGGGKYARIRQVVKLKPYRAYRLSLWAKTQGFNNWADARFVVSGAGPILSKRYRPFGTPKIWTTLSGTHGWRYSQTDFNSLKSTSASLEFAVSDPKREQVGTIWVDDIKLEEVGLFETVRRKQCPIVVTSEDGATTYKEGTDYVIHPKCSNFTDESFWYQANMTIPQGSSIANGQALRVSWYQMSDVEQIHPEANFCLSQLREAFRDNVERMDEIYEDNRRMFLGFDEWRTAFWDDRCELYPKARTAGEYMAGALKMTHDLVWTTNPSRELYLINDMYDPYHNAWKPYAMTNGGCLNSWKNMNTNIIIWNWRPGPHWDKMSMRFYMGIDDSLNPEGKVWRQILSVMDGAGASKRIAMAEELERQGGKGVIGIGYVDWYNNYSQMAAVRNACLAKGRWGSDPLPTPNIRRPSRAKLDGSRLSASSGPDRKIQLEYSLGHNARVSLAVTTVQGRRVANLVNAEKEMGTHQIAWDASSLPAGVYFLRLSIDGVGQQALKQVVF